MAIIKSFTSLEQSKKLAEILPLESADMHYTGHQSIINPKEWEYEAMPNIRGKYISFDDKRIFYPCWSLAALLNVIPKRIKDYNVLRIDISDNDFAVWYDEIGYGVNNDLPDITKESAIDACYEMIIKLHKQELL
jgi:hypothetical protein